MERCYLTAKACESFARLLAELDRDIPEFAPWVLYQDVPLLHVVGMGDHPYAWMWRHPLDATDVPGVVSCVQNFDEGWESWFDARVARELQAFRAEWNSAVGVKQLFFSRVHRGPEWRGAWVYEQWKPKHGRGRTPGEAVRALLDSVKSPAKT